MLIAQISDTHIAAPGQKTLGVAPMADNLQRCVTAINALSMKPDLVLLSGDVTNESTAAEADHAAGILNALECPYYLVPGNHDSREVLWDVFGGGAIPSRSDGFDNYVIQTPDMRVIALDSVARGQAGGMFCATRAKWLRSALAQGGNQPAIIFMHHPPLKFGVPETDQDGFSGAGLLGEIVAAHTNIERILCGHIHLLAHARWNGTIVTTAPSMGMQLALDLTQSGPSKFLLSEPAFLLHHWTPEQTLITHAVQVSNLGEPNGFEPYNRV